MEGGKVDPYSNLAASYNHCPFWLRKVTLREVAGALRGRDPLPGLRVTLGSAGLYALDGLESGPSKEAELPSQRTSASQTQVCVVGSWEPTFLCMMPFGKKICTKEA